MKVPSKIGDGKRVKEVGKRLRKLRIIDTIQNHGGHTGVENGISSREIGEIVGCERSEVITEMYSVTLYFRKMGKNLQRFKPPTGDSLYYFAADEEEESLGLETHAKRISATLRSLWKKTVIAHQNFPNLAYTYELRLEDGVILQIKTPTEKKREPNRLNRNLAE